MPDFLAQSYVAHREQAVAAVGRARLIRTPLLLRAVLIPGDEIFLTFWRGADADAVGTAARDVGLSADRIVHVEELAAERRPECGRV
jgi:hypothetical protein